MATIDDYLDLVPASNSSQSNFVAVLTAVLTPILETNNTLQSVPSQFDLDNAIGVQLDTLGEWVGLSRYLDAPISGVYFSLDTVGVGFDEGVWFGPFDSLTGLTRLDDETYRLILKIKVAANSWDGSLRGANDILTSLSSGGTLISVIDRFDMSFDILVSGTIPSALFIAILQQALVWIKPGGVRINNIYVTSATGAPVFGFDIANDYINGFDVGAWAITY